MRLTVKVWILLAIIFSFFATANPIMAHDSWHTISTEKLAGKIENKDDFCLINVLPKIIYDEKHIRGSINIPLGEIKISSELPADKKTPLVFYCMGML